jgi:hypothetical protein
VGYGNPSPSQVREIRNQRRLPLFLQIFVPSFVLEVILDILLELILLRHERASGAPTGFGVR